MSGTRYGNLRNSPLFAGVDGTRQEVKIDWKKIFERSKEQLKNLENHYRELEDLYRQKGYTNLMYRMNGLRVGVGEAIMYMEISEEEEVY